MTEARLKNVRGFQDLVVKALEEARKNLEHSRKRAHEIGLADPITKYWEGRESALREMRFRLDAILKDESVRGRTPDTVIYDESDNAPEHTFEPSKMVMYQSDIKQEQYKLTPAQIAFFECLEDTAKQIGSAERAEVERRILAGEDDITVKSGHSHVRYIVPSPWRHPIRRLRIAVARARHQWRIV